MHFKRIVGREKEKKVKIKYIFVLQMLHKKERGDGKDNMSANQMTVVK